jgi:putative membrane protein insertion efficiency factor
MVHLARRIAGEIAKAPIHAYRWTLKPLIGWECRHLPTCSEYALEAIDRNGAWRGGWLALSRICRCHPLAPWRYGRWRGRQLADVRAHPER